MDCALPAGSACDDWDGNLDQGSRLYVYGAADALDEVGEWSWDEASDVVSIFSSSRPDTVVVPTLSTLLEIGVGADGVEVAGVTFADCDYDSYGFQLSPDASGGRWEPGIPHDAALRVHGAHDVVVRDCVFSNLGGGGVLVAEASARAVVRDSEFRNLGQSAVFLSGNGTTQPRFATIVDNAMSGVGEVLAAAGGLVCATCSHARFERNAVERSGRWGVNFKTSDVQAAHSENNTIAENVFRDIGTATADTGAVYLVADDGDTRFNSTIRWNRMVNVMGVKSEWSGGGGILETPASSYGVYLDNSASGVTVRGNVVADVATAAYFVHEGRANHFFDNVAYNVSNARKSGGVNKAVSGGDGDALLLAAGDAHAALADVRVVARGEVADELVRERRLRGRGDGRRVRAVDAVGDVAVDRRVEELRLLGHDGEVAPEERDVQRPERPAVEEHVAARRVVEPQQQVERRRLARARLAHQRQRRPRRHVEVEAPQHVPVGPRVVREEDARVPHASRDFAGVVAPAALLRHGLQQPQHALRRAARAREG